VVMAGAVRCTNLTAAIMDFCLYACETGSTFTGKVATLCYDMLFVYINIMYNKMNKIRGTSICETNNCYISFVYINIMYNKMNKIRSTSIYETKNCYISFVYINIMYNIMNKIRDRSIYKTKNYYTTSESFLCYDLLCIFRFIP
jgi:hypothetical protein